MDADAEFDIREFIPYLLNQAAEESSLAFQRIYKNRYGMLRAEWRVLFHLGVYKCMTAKDIGFMAKMHKTKISRAVQKMQEKGYLTRVQDNLDRRKEWLELTVKGKAVYTDLRQAAKEYDAVLVAHLSAMDASTLKRLLKVLTLKTA